MAVKNVKLKVVGVTFTNEDTGTNRQDVIKKLDEHAAIFLVREPTNKFDKNAVRVETLFGQAGYIGKDYAEIIAGMMDSGTRFAARVDKVDEYKGTHYLHIIIDEVE